MKTMIILSTEEVAMARAGANERIQACQKRAEEFGAVNKQECDEPSFNVNYAGVLGEVAYAKMFNLDTTPIFDTSSHDPGYDFVHRNRKVDVKGTFTHVDNPRLIINRENSRKPDIFALIQIALDEDEAAVCTFHGYMPKTRAMAPHRLKSANAKKGYDPAYITNCEELMDWL